MRSLLIGLLMLALLVGGVAASRRAFGQASSPTAEVAFRIVRDLPLSGGTSRFDYQSLDPVAHRLYIAHLGASLVTVVDTQSGGVVGDVPGVSSAHGVLVVPELGRVYASATGTNQVAVIDAQSLALVALIPAGDYPDGLAYSPDVGKLYVSDEHGRTDTVIDVQTNQPVATIALGGGAGNTQFDPGSRLIYVAVHDANQLVAIDPNSDQIVGRYDLAGCNDPHGLSINPIRRTAFVACQGNAVLLALDLSTMQILGSQPVGKSPDVLAFDPTLERLYVAAESGPLTVIAQDETGIRTVFQGDAGPDAHSVAVDPDTHHLYLPLRNVGGRPVLREAAVEPS